MSNHRTFGDILKYYTRRNRAKERRATKQRIKQEIYLARSIELQEQARVDRLWMFIFTAIFALGTIGIVLSLTPYVLERIAR